jgi:hypothetical protein
MFRDFAALFTAPGPVTAAVADQVLTSYRPSQLAELLEVLWLLRVPGSVFGEPPPPALLLGQEKSRPALLLQDLMPQLPAAGSAILQAGMVYPHLIYAYMVESTNAPAIFRKVLAEWTSGGALPMPSPETQRWIRATEALFYGPSFPYSIRSVTSYIRPDAEAVRRNSYYRLLGMDLGHNGPDGRPYPFVKPESANRDFARTFESLLVEVWKAYINVPNISGANATDDNAIAEILRRLREMLQSQRRNGVLSREEMDAVACLAWIHLTLDFDTQIVVDLDAQAPSPAERLAKIGARVGVPAHSRSDAFFRIAEPVAIVTREIENNIITGTPGAQALYMGAYTPLMLDNILHWSTLTGRDIKELAFVQGPSPLLQVPRTQSIPLRIGAVVA